MSQQRTSKWSFTLGQMLVATFWLACAAGTFAAGARTLDGPGDVEWKFLAAFVGIWFGIPSFIGLAVGTIVGQRWGCGIALMCFVIGIALLIRG